jgi:DNA-directed RNA polymerase specialized sigma24 family protein
MTPAEGSVTRWLRQLQVGDRAAVQPLWERYFRRLVGLARQQLQGVPRGAADEEDVALSAFASFCLAAEQGRFPQLLDRDSLWRLLVVVTARKAAHRRRDEGRQKRGGVRFVSDLPGDPDEVSVLGQALSREPDPAFAALVAEEYRLRLARLEDPELEAVARWRMEGYTVEEIAGRLGCVSRSVKRKLQLIRGIWEKERGND